MLIYTPLAFSLYFTHPSTAPAGCKVGGFILVHMWGAIWRAVSIRSPLLGEYDLHADSFAFLALGSACHHFDTFAFTPFVPGLQRHAISDFMVSDVYYIC